VQSWLESDCHLTAAAARNLLWYVRRQIEQAGCVPTDKTLLIEGFRDQVGDWHVAVLSPFGSRFNLALRLAVEGRFRQRFGYHPQCLHHDDGLLLRVADMDEPPLDLLDGLTPENVEPLILAELDDSALFAIRFRQNAARALLMPRTRPDKRAPLWLQRLKGRSLLQIAKQHPGFPVVVETYRECLHDHLDLPRLVELLKDIATGQVELVRRRADTPSPFASSLLFGFTAAFMYDYDRVDARGVDSAPPDRQLLDQILKPSEHGHLLDPRAVHQVERRLRGVGLPPRTVEEMAEWLRRLGDLTPQELDGSMPEFLQSLAAQGRAQRITLAGVAAPERWILTEESDVYRKAFQQESSGSEAATIILRRFLQSHALVGLADILARYPFASRWAEEQLNDWVRTGSAVAVPAEVSVQFALPANLQQVQRTSLALQRREILSCPPHQFVDFLLRWQQRHPATQREGPDGLRSVLEQLEGLSLPAELWEQTVLPSRVKDYQGRWLDELIQGGEWLWLGHGTDKTDIAFIVREHLAQHSRPTVDEAFPASTDAVYEHLRQHGASFLLDVAQQVGTQPGRVRKALWQLLRAGLATNDRFDVIRRGEEPDAVEVGQGNPRGRPTTRRRVASLRPEGRWSLVHYGMPESEARAVHQASLLLERYGVVCRDLAMLDESLVSWRVLYEVLSRMEWAGDVRRGYFVEGLSGAQFALPEAAQQLAALARPALATEPAILLHSQDPANLYGSGAPLEGPLNRRGGNWLVLRAGRPILWIENHGRRLTPSPQATPDDLTAAAACLRELLRTGHGVQLRGKVVVDEWNGQPITSTAGRDVLEAAGFVRDYQAMTLYAGW
jgi:ATP-dependent Lhr-like helicase